LLIAPNADSACTVLSDLWRSLQRRGSAGGV